MTADREPPRHLTSRQRAWRVFLFIALAGPPIGALLILVPMMVANGWGGDGGGGTIAIVEVLQFAAMLAVFGYLLGGLPALLSAIWLARRTALRGSFGYGEALATAVASAVLGNALLGLLLGEPRNIAAGALAFVPVAIAAGIACRFLLARLGWIGRP